MIHRIRDRGEAGFTTVELLVVVFIMGIVMIMLFNFMDQATTVTGKATRDAETEKDVQRALRTATEDIRGAHPIGAACTSTSDTATPALPAGYDNCLQFTVVRNTSGTGSCPKTVFIYALVNKAFVEDRVDYDATCTLKSTVTRRRLLANVVNTASQPLFTYYAGDGTQLSTSATPSPIPTSSSIKVSLYVQYQKNAPVLPFFSIVAPRNNTTR